MNWISRIILFPFAIIAAVIIAAFLIATTDKIETEEEDMVN